MILKSSDVCQKMTQEEGGLLEFMAVFGGKIRFSDTKFDREFRIIYRALHVRFLIMYCTSYFVQLLINSIRILPKLNIMSEITS
jgi:hypothetical protein